MSSRDSNGRVESRRRCGKSFVPSSSYRFEGIIAHLTKRCRGNVHDHNIVTILMTAGWQGGWAKHLVILTNNTQFCAMNVPNQWICDDFMTMLIESPDYSIRSYSAVLGYVNQRNWWLRDQRMGSHRWNLTVATGTTIWMGQMRRQYFRCRSGSVRMSRLQQRGPNYMGNDYLGMNVWAIFGSLIEWWTCCLNKN
jgi:hypothetical protein